MNNPMFTSINNQEEVVYSRSNCATYKGITTKTLILLFISILSAALSIATLYTQEGMGLLIGLLLTNGIVGMITILIGRTSPRASCVCGIIYAISEGAFLGVLSCLLNLFYEGIALVAIISTLAVFGAMLGLFASGVIRNKSKIYSFTITLGISILFMSLAMLIMSIIPACSAIFNNIGIMIAVEVLFMVYACTMLLSNFYEAQQLVQNGCGKEQEWCCSFGLLVSILYIYVEILRLLVILYQLFGNRD